LCETDDLTVASTQKSVAQRGDENAGGGEVFQDGAQVGAGKGVVQGFLNDDVGGVRFSSGSSDQPGFFGSKSSPAVPTVLDPEDFAGLATDLAVS